MTPLNAAITELQLVTDQAYAKGMALLVKHAEQGTRPTADELDDHRTELVANLLDAIDRVVPDLGATYHQALYPFSPMGDDGAVQPLKGLAL